jgi:hypothetical protein
MNAIPHSAKPVQLTAVLVQFAVLVGLLFLPSSATAQRPHVRLAVGTSTMGGGDYASLFEDVVASYQSRGVDVGVQRLFPAWWTAEADGFYPLGPVELGVRLQVQRTQADALYSDPAGTLDIRSELCSVFVEPQVAAWHAVAPWLRVGASVHAGVALTSSDLTQLITIDYAPFSGREEAEAEASGRGLSLGASLLIAVPVGPVDASLRLGGRWARVRGVEVEERVNGTVLPGEPATLDYDVSGISATLGIGL